MSTLPLKDPADVGRLGSAAERLEKACEGGGRVDGRTVWTVRRPSVRAYVWAVYMGFDPVLAIARRHFGARSLDELGPGGVEDCRDKVKLLAARVDQLSISIPRRSARPLRAQRAAA